MKNGKHIALTIAAAAAAMAGCGKIAVSQEETEKPAENVKYIKVSTEIKTRVETTGSGSEIFSENDRISVYAWTGSNTSVPAAADRVVNNSINTLNGNSWTPDVQMLWKNPVDPHYFIGIYPATPAPVADLTAGDFDFDMDDQTASDLLVAVNTDGVRSNANPVNLDFRHVMAKLIVKLTYRDQWGGTPEVEAVNVLNFFEHAKVNYLTGAVTPAQDRAVSGKLPEVEENTRYESVMIPQSGVQSITIRINAHDYTFTHSKDIKLEGGKYTTVNIIVGRDEVKLGGITIKDWEEGEKIEGGEALD